MKIGDKFICIDSILLNSFNHLSTHKFTKGKTYIIKQIGYQKRWIKDDNNFSHGFTSEEIKKYFVCERIFKLLKINESRG